MNKGIREYIKFQKLRWAMMTKEATEIHLRIIRNGSDPNDADWTPWDALMDIGIADEREVKALLRIYPQQK